MAISSTIAHWQAEIQTRLPHFSCPQAKVLAYWSCGMILAQTCALSKVVFVLACVLGCTQDSIRHRLCEWYLDAEDKKGSGSHHKGVKRREIVIETCFVPLMAWVLSLWQAPTRQLALALDATTLSKRFTVLTLCVLFRRTAIPVAWYVMTVNQPGEWKSHWKELLQAVKPAIGPQWEVIVLTDRGLYSPDLFRGIVALGWHPFMRASELLSVLPKKHTGKGWYWKMQEILPAQGRQWNEDVLCSETERLGCHMLASWQYGYLERWIIIIDMGFNEAQLAWYGMRFWIETSFKQQKSGGWQWQVTHMSEPQRAARMWLVMSVSSLWAISAGAQLEVEEQERQERKERQAAAAQEKEKPEKPETREMCLITIPAVSSAFPQPALAESGRQASGASGQPVKKAVATQSCFTRGRAFLWAELYRQEPWMPSCLPAEAWPSEPPPPRFVLTPRQQQEQQQQIARRTRNRKAEQRKERNRKARQEQAALTNMS